ncbi:MAG: tRNA epoxyqueuosine(34) reductase QueG [Bacteroidetes bacterium]|nr:tRNA epoxyqueuosine(34) reductase QueG [Bacteroidota bacterium]
MKEEIRQRALELGFDVCGFAEARPLDYLRNFYNQFIDEDRQATIAYLKRYAPQRLDPEVLLPGVKTVIALLINYYPPELIPEEDNFIISKHAHGKRYPPLIKTKLNQLTRFVDSFDKTGCTSRLFVDSGPVLEKTWAQRCGIGWQGKNTVIINPSRGSFFFIGIILTTLEIEPDRPETDHCGTCTRCMEACPTGALDRPYQLDIRRCISYCTIVDKAEMPDDVRSNLGGRIFGCDICQDVCPYNRDAMSTSETHFHASEALKKMRRNDWINLTKDQFNELFAGTSVGEKGYEGLMKNVMIVMG